MRHWWSSMGLRDTGHNGHSWPLGAVGYKCDNNASKWRFSKYLDKCTAHPMEWQFKKNPIEAIRAPLCGRGVGTVGAALLRVEFLEVLGVVEGPI